jgi:DNA-binding MarR family transcriptional regulator
VARPPNPEKLASIYRAVQERPSQCPGAIARLLSISLSQVTRRLPALEQRGYLLSEAGRGGLWPFRLKER